MRRGLSCPSRACRPTVGPVSARTLGLAGLHGASPPLGSPQASRRVNLSPLTGAHAHSSDLACRRLPASARLRAGSGAARCARLLSVCHCPAAAQERRQEGSQAHQQAVCPAHRAPGKGLWRFGRLAAGAPCAALAYPFFDHHCHGGRRRVVVDSRRRFVRSIRHISRHSASDYLRGAARLAAECDAFYPGDPVLHGNGT